MSDQPYRMGAGSPPDADEQEAPAEQESEGSDEKTTTIEPEMLPDGMDPKPGDILKFKVVGKTTDGNIQIKCAEGKGDGEDGGQWGDDLKKEGVY